MTEALMLLGPTGSGKSALALELAQHLAIEIVSVDSAQVYRGLDIGTAKPSASERAAVAHHLLDLRDPVEPYSAADFVSDALAAIAGIRARGRLPLLVGGTMFYAKALREGLSNLPPADASVRSALNAEAREMGWPALHARLAALDAETAARLEPNDAQRIQRALEVIMLTGTPMSELLSRGQSAAHAIETVALMPADRPELHRRLEARFDVMLKAGLVAEVEALRARGDLTPDLPSMRSVGYRQAWSYLDGATDLAGFRSAAIAATRQLAKRQLTWLRSLAPSLIVDPVRDDALGTLRQHARAVAGV